MKIQQQNNNIQFGQVYVKSKDAEKLLKKADRAVKRAKNTIFINTNIPENHKKPLWSVLSGLLNLRQADNPNHILIDVADKSKHLLSIKNVDNKGFVTRAVEVSPMPEFGTKNDFFPQDDMYRHYVQSLDMNTYGKSDFFNVIDNAEYEADMLLQEQLKNKPEAKTCIKLLPKENKNTRDSNIILNPRRIEKARLKIKEHVQRPFEDFRKLLTSAIEPENTKKTASSKEKMPRRLKKEIKKNSNL